MTRPDDSLTIEQKCVVVFDICSSTTILEDLLRSDSEKRWRDLLIDIKRFLVAQREVREFEIYKFMGDGWILLFDIDYPAADLFLLLKRLSDTYKAAFKKRVRSVLSIEIGSIGLTFGLEMGRLIRFEINEKQEYIGRPINVAARLQSAVKNGDSTPEGKVLMSKRAYDHVRGEVSDLYKAQTVTRNLSNVAGGEGYRAIKLMLY